jgi:hypothetical protein
MNLVPVMKRLKEHGNQRVRAIKGSVDFASAVREGVKQPPVQFVVLGSHRDSANSFGTQVVSQQRQVDFSVVTVVSHLGDARGDAAQDVLNEFLAPTLSALQGFVPGEGFDPIEANGGSVLEFKDGQLWWQDRFLTRYENRTGVSQ